MSSPTEIADQIERTIAACNGRAFNFAQGSAARGYLLGQMIGQASPADSEPFYLGASDHGVSQGVVDLAKIFGSDAPGSESLDSRLWFRDDALAYDFSPLLAGFAAHGSVDAAMPVELGEGAVQASRTGSAGRGCHLLLTNFCAGRIVLDPSQILAVIGSVNVATIEEYEAEPGAGRTFGCHVPTSEWLGWHQLDHRTLLDQLNTLGFRPEGAVGRRMAAALDDRLPDAPVQLAWTIDADDRVGTAQAVLNLTELFTEIFTLPEVAASFAKAERTTVDEWNDFVTSAVDRGQMGFMSMVWQTFEFDGDREPVSWPNDAPDLSERFAEHLGQDAPTAAANEPAPEPAGPSPTGDVVVDVDAEMIEQLRRSSGAMYFTLRGVDVDEAVAAMQRAVAAVFEVRHPDEPTESLASFASDVVATDDGAQFWADISDMEEETQVLQELIVSVARAIGDAGAGGRLDALK